MPLSTQLSSVQALLSLQSLAPVATVQLQVQMPEAQVPALHLSPVVQAWLSSQVVPFATGVNLHEPEVGSQADVLQAFPLHFTGVVEVQVPATQASLRVHGLPSLHTVPSLKLLRTHLPVLLSHAALWQASPLHNLGLPPTHKPLPLHASSWVQALLSSHTLPTPAMLVLQPWLDSTQLAGAQAVPVQVTAVPAAQPPLPSQWSPVVQTRPSEQLVEAGLNVLTHCFALSSQLPVLHAPVRLLQSTAAPALHAPWPSHASPLVQNSPSLQVVPACLGFLSHAKLPAPVAEQVPTVQSEFAAEQSGVLPATHAPAAQASPWVQPLSSALQVVPSVLAVVKHWPVEGLQAAVAHWPGAGQSMGALPLTQLPSWHWPELGFWHLSPVSQAWPLLAGVITQAPALQASCVHGLLSLQSLSVLHAQVKVALHWPPLQLSVVQGSPSSQVAPSSAENLQPLSGSHWAEVHGLPSSHRATVPTWTQVPVVSQLSTVQATPSLQSILLPKQTPPWHTSPLVHTLPSLHTPAPGVFWQPSTGSQLSVVQGFLSSQSAGMAPRQAPALHALLWVQALPSLHAVPSSAALVAHLPLLGSQATGAQAVAPVHTTARLGSALQ